MRSVEELDPKGKKILMRVDWNVTVGKALKVVDDTRIKRTEKTIRYLLDGGAKQLILLSHLGRPEGKRVPELSLYPVVEYASGVLGEKIVLAEQLDKVGEEKLVMLENLRFFEGEEQNSREFSKQLASLAEAYVNEGFGVSHREVASTVGVPEYLPAYAGFNLAEETERILGAVQEPRRPLVVVVGGAKVEDKLKLLTVLSHKADTLLLGGKLANEFVQRGVRLNGKAEVIVPLEGSKLLDIGPATQKLFAEKIAQAGTVVWNGPMGKVEEEEYREGTHAIYEALLLNEPAEVIVGGGDTLAALRFEKHLERIDFVSTGGGAMLELLEKGTLPGIEVLSEHSENSESQKIR